MTSPTVAGSGASVSVTARPFGRGRTVVVAEEELSAVFGSAPVPDTWALKVTSPTACGSRKTWTVVAPFGASVAEQRKVPPPSGAVHVVPAAGLVEPNLVFAGTVIVTVAWSDAGPRFLTLTV